MAAVFLAQVGYVGAGGFEDPQAQQPEHGYQGEAVIVHRLARGGQQRLELEVSEPESGRFGRDIRPADMLGRGRQRGKSALGHSGLPRECTCMLYSYSLQHLGVAHTDGRAGWTDGSL